MRAVLFDLDGTLLDLDLEGFLGRYFHALEEASLPLARVSLAPEAFMQGLHEATAHMMRPHPGRTNRSVFYERLLELTGIDLHQHWDVYDRFYQTTFPLLGGTARPAPGARRVILTARELGLHVAIATNPIFPKAAVDHRLAWAGLDDIELPVVTTFEQMEACKPDPAYFAQTAALLGVDPTECLMVGDDARLDMPASDIGMRTYYVGDDDGADAEFVGDLDGLADLLPQLI